MVPSFLHRRRRGPAGLALLLAAGIAQAQTSPVRAERPDPLDPQAQVPAATYRSPLATYRPLVDEKPVPWKEANETVNRIGGWRVYMREAQQPEPGASAPAPRTGPAPASGSAPGAGGHKMH